MLGEDVHQRPTIMGGDFTAETEIRVTRRTMSRCFTELHRPAREQRMFASTDMAVGMTERERCTVRSGRGVSSGFTGRVPTEQP